MNTNQVCIAKEQIPQYKFTQQDSLSADPSARAVRVANLLRAERLGNAFHGKVRICFQTQEDSNCVVDTTVWSVGEDFICLKGGVTMPVSAITSVDFS